MDRDGATLSRRPGGIAEVGLLAYPVVLQTLSDTVMQVVDNAIVGRLGTTELAAVGLGAVWLWTLLVGFVGAANGVQTFVAQAFGAQRRRECGVWLWQGLYTMLPVALAWIIVIALGFSSFLTLLSAPHDLIGPATQYALARLPGVPALVVGVSLTAFFRGLGDTRTPLFGTILVNIANILLAIGLVFGKFGLPRLGLSGAGWAMSLANWFYAAMMMVAFLRSKRRAAYATWPCAPQPAAMLRFMRTAFPMGGQWLLDMITFALFSTIIAWMGQAPMAASQAMIQFLSLSFMQAYGISIASGALVGRYIGARNLQAAEDAHRSALRLGLLLAISVAVLFISVPDVLLGLFTRDPEVLKLGRPLLALGALFQLIDAIGIIASGALRGAGDTRFPLLVQAVTGWVVRLPLVYVAAVLLQGGVLGAWFAELCYVLVLGTIWLVRFERGAWRAIRI